MTHVVVFVASGCGACHDYMPRLVRASNARRRYDVLRFHVFDMTRRLSGSALRLAQSVDATPTTVVIKNGSEAERKVGALDDAEIAALLERALA